jgi:hypothetical protein
MVSPTASRSVQRRDVDVLVAVQLEAETVDALPRIGDEVAPVRDQDLVPLPAQDLRLGHRS